MDTSSLPVWAQAASLIAIALVAAIVGVFKYLKTDEKTELVDLRGVIRDLQDYRDLDTKRLMRLLDDLNDSVTDLTEAMMVQTEMIISFHRFLKLKEKRDSLLGD